MHPLQITNQELSIYSLRNLLLNTNQALSLIKNPGEPKAYTFLFQLA